MAVPEAAGGCNSSVWSFGAGTNGELDACDAPGCGGTSLARRFSGKGGRAPESSSEEAGDVENECVGDGGRGNGLAKRGGNDRREVDRVGAGGGASVTEAEPTPAAWLGLPSKVWPSAAGGGSGGSARLIKSNGKTANVNVRNPPAQQRLFFCST